MTSEAFRKNSSKDTSLSSGKPYGHEFEMEIVYEKDGSKKTTMKWFGQEFP